MEGEGKVLKRVKLDKDRKGRILEGFEEKNIKTMNIVYDYKVFRGETDQLVSFWRE